MIQVRLRLPLEDDEYQALLKAANEELRSTADQVRFVLRQDLIRRGLLREVVQEENADPKGHTAISRRTARRSIAPEGGRTTV